jgi:hypothetical protein
MPGTWAHSQLVLEQAHIHINASGLLCLWVFLQSFRKNAKKSSIKRLAAKAACRVKNRLQAIFGD